MFNLMLYANSMGSGKTYFAERLVSLYGYKKLSLATPLKDYVHTLLLEKGIDFNPNEKDTVLEGGKTLRDYYIMVGEDTKDKYGQDHWVKLLINQIKDDLTSPYVIDDVRTPLEYKVLTEHGFKPIMVDRLLETPDNKMEGLLNHLPIIHYYPNYYDNNDSLIKMFMKVLHGEASVTWKQLTTLLNKGVEIIVNQYESTEEFNLDIKLKQLKKHGEYGGVEVYNNKELILTSELKSLEDLPRIVNMVREVIRREDKPLSWDEYINNQDAILELLNIDEDED
jgi:hypothetical protein